MSTLTGRDEGFDLFGGGFGFEFSSTAQNIAKSLPRQ